MGAPTREDEARAERILERFFRDILVELRIASMKKLLEKGEVDPAKLRAIRAEMQRIVREHSSGLAYGAWGEMLRDAAISGAVLSAGTLGAESLAVDPKFVKVALFNSNVRIKDILEDGVRVVNRTIADAAATGKNKRQIADLIEKNLNLRTGKVPRWRADRIAQGELHSVYRQSMVQTATRHGTRHFTMKGPIDVRTEPICLRYVGMTKTVEEWEAISDTVFTYGLHYGCRHGWIPADGPQERDDLAKQRAAAALDRRRKTANQTAARKRSA